MTDPAPGDILEFNGSIFSAMLKEWSAVPVLYPIVKDKFDDIKAMVEKALSQCDIVLLNAGSSAGREDFSSKVIGKLGTLLYHGIAAKPGKPAILGYQGKKPILGVPGYPVSGIIVIEEILKPLLEQWNHTAADSPVYEEARLSRAVISGLKYKEFVRVRLGYVNGELIASPLSRGSGVISSFMKADGMLEIPQGTEGYETGAVVKVRLLRNKNELKHTLVAIGSHDPLLDELRDMIHTANSNLYMSSSHVVKVRLLRNKNELKHTLVAIGSHDPLLDELRDMIHTANSNLYMSSSHVGSMGGIMSVRRRENHIAGIHLLNEADGTYNIMIHTANSNLYMSSSHVGSMGGIMSVRRRENHIAGIHLLNEADGTYNISFLKKYFPQGGIKLVECVGRTQGIMVAKGNPLGISSMKDLQKAGLRYVNRQKGSGTRILLDYLCKKENLDTTSIYGYEREEFTHTSVAAQIASGSADAGLGIYSAAMLYDLDFVPICTEQYDLLIPDYAWDTPMVQELLSILKSDAFRERLEQLGYDLDFVPICTEQYDLLIPDYAWDTPMVQELLSILKSDAFRERLEQLGGYTLEHPGTIRYE